MAGELPKRQLGGWMPTPTIVFWGLYDGDFPQSITLTVGEGVAQWKAIIAFTSEGRWSLEATTPCVADRSITGGSVALDTSAAAQEVSDLETLGNKIVPAGLTPQPVFASTKPCGVYGSKATTIIDWEIPEGMKTGLQEIEKATNSVSLVTFFPSADGRDRGSDSAGRSYEMSIIGESYIFEKIESPCVGSDLGLLVEELRTPK